MSQRLPTTVLAWIPTRIAAVTSESNAAGWQASAYRLSLDQEPEFAVEGLYFVDCPSHSGPGPHLGAPENIYSLGVNIDVGYLRPGGDLGGGDYQSVNRSALDDMHRLADVLAHPSYYDGDNTGIRRVIYRGADRVASRQLSEIWRARFDIEYRCDLVTV